MRGFNVVGLDENYQMTSLLRPINLQWTRKYHEAGMFSIQIPIDQYSEDIRYIYTNARPEVGVVQQKNYIETNGIESMHLSGYFDERSLNKMVVYPKGNSNVIDAPTWIVQKGPAEYVATTFFDAFKKMTVGSVEISLEMSTMASQSRGNIAEHTRNGEMLGDKIYAILKPSGMSYRINYDFTNNVKSFGIWQGLDRTEGNADGNNPIIFSKKYGNIKKPNVIMSDVEYKNACAVMNPNTGVTRIVLNQADDDKDVRILSYNSSLNPNDYSSTEAYYAAMDAEGLNELKNYIKVINMEFDAMAGSYEYMEDFDLGDLCTIEIDTMKLSAKARLIGCYEVMKSGEWTMTMEFGTPLIVKR